MKFLDYFFAARPPLLIPVWSIFLVALHYHHQLAGKVFSISDFSVLLGITMLAAAAYYINQIYDAESDSLNRKVLFLEKGLVSVHGLKILFLVLSIIPLAVAAPLSRFTFGIFIQLFILAYIYSAPPIRLKDRPIGGLLANAWSFGFLIPVLIMPEMTQHNMGLLGWDNPFYFFLSVMGVHILTTIPDSAGDRKSGKKTVATIFPLRTNLFLTLVAFSGAALIAIKSGFPLLLFIAVIAGTFTLLTVIFPKTSLITVAAKLPVLLLTILAGYFYPIYILFIVVLILSTRAYYQNKFGIKYPGLF